MSQEGKSVAIPDEIIIQKIYLIRSKKVMLERDLAESYKEYIKDFDQSNVWNMKQFYLLGFIYSRQILP